MDSVSRPEFHTIFDRISTKVNLKGAMTAIEIEARMKLAVLKAKEASESIRMIEDLKKTLRRELGKKATQFDQQIMHLKSGINLAMAGEQRRRADQIDKLIEHDFAGRAIFEGNRAPKGIIAYTLQYGRQEALRRISAQQRAAVRSGRAGLRERAHDFRDGLRGLNR